MGGCDEWSVFKAFEVILCISSLIYKRWTDEEASRLFFFLEKRSKEWPLLNNVTWNRAGSWFADVTFGGYTIITVALFIAHIVGELRHTRKTESFLLGIGSLLFFGVGCMVITSFDNVPESLIDNAIILGVLAIITGFIFLIDISCFKRREYSDKINRQDKEFRIKQDTTERKIKEAKEILIKERATESKNSSAKNDVKKTNHQNVNTNATQDKVITELRSSMKKGKEKPVNDELTYKIVDEKLQTKADIQHGIKYLANEGLNKKESKLKSQSDIEHDNSYEYDEESIKNYDGNKTTVNQNSDDNSSETDSNYHDRKSRGSQTSRSYIMEEKAKNKRDVETFTESPQPIKSKSLDYSLQSPKISTTNPHKADSQTSEESYELHTSTSLYSLSKNGRTLLPTITTSSIEKLSQHEKISNQIYNKTNSVPSSPQDPGYVLHTVSKWPNTTTTAPQSYQQWKEKNKILKPIHSAV